MHPCCWKCHYFVLFYSWVIFYCYGYLSFFVLTIVNNAAMNPECMYPFGSCFSLDIHPGVKLQDHMTTLLFFFFFKSPYFSPQQLQSIYISICSVGRFPFIFFHTLSSIYYSQKIYLISSLPLGSLHSSLSLTMSSQPLLQGPTLTVSVSVCPVQIQPWSQLVTPVNCS